MENLVSFLCPKDRENCPRIAIYKNSIKISNLGLESIFFSIVVVVSVVFIFGRGFENKFFRKKINWAIQRNYF